MRVDMNTRNANWDKLEDLDTKVDDHLVDYTSHTNSISIESLTPINGWSGEVRVVKNPHGIVELSYNLTVGTTLNGTTIVGIPDGYSIFEGTMSIPHLNNSTGAQGLGLYIDATNHTLRIYSLQNAVTGNNISGKCTYINR